MNDQGLIKAEDSKKRYSHLTIMKEYEMPIVDSSLDESNITANKKQHEPVINVDHIN